MAVAPVGRPLRAAASASATRLAEMAAAEAGLDCGDSEWRRFSTAGQRKASGQGSWSARFPNAGSDVVYLSDQNRWRSSDGLHAGSIFECKLPDGTWQEQFEVSDSTAA